MYKVEKEFVTSSKSHCKVGKITYKKNITIDSESFHLDFKTEAFKKSNVLFTGKIRNL